MFVADVFVPLFVMSGRRRWPLFVTRSSLLVLLMTRFFLLRSFLYVGYFYHNNTNSTMSANSHKWSNRKSFHIAIGSDDWVHKTRHTGTAVV